MRDAAILITGGGSGLGAACARLLASHGARVGLLGRREERLRNAVDAITGAGGQATALVADVRNYAAMQDAVASFQPDALINAAGMLGQGSIYDALGPDLFAEVHAINVQGSFNSCVTAMRFWQSRGSAGDIVNISSLGGIRGMQAFPGFAAYASSKHAVVGLTEALALEGKEHDVRVNAIAPGTMRSEMTEALGLTPSTLPADVAPTVAYLLDRSQSGPLTGTTIEIHCND